MDIINNFNIYLEKWCKEHNKPLAKIEEKNEVWKEAWKSYLEEELVKDWDKYKEEYLNMPVLTRYEQEKRKQELNDKEEQKETEETEPNYWEQVQSYLNK